VGDWDLVAVVNLGSGGLRILSESICGKVAKKGVQFFFEAEGTVSRPEGQKGDSMQKERTSTRRTKT